MSYYSGLLVRGFSDAEIPAASNQPIKYLDMRGLEAYDCTIKGYIDKEDKELREQILSLMHEVNNLHSRLSVLEQEKNDRNRSDFKIVCGLD